MIDYILGMIANEHYNIGIVNSPRLKSWAVDSSELSPPNKNIEKCAK